MVKWLIGLNYKEFQVLVWKFIKWLNGCKIRTFGRPLITRNICKMNEWVHLGFFYEFPNFLWPMPREFWFLVKKNWPFSKYMSIWCSIWCIWLHVARAPLEYSPMAASFPKYSRMLALTLAERRILRLVVHMIHMIISPWGKWNLRRLQMVFASKK